MKVFISSVTHLLKDERTALPPFLGLLGHEGLRFEDFRAQDRSGREACLAGVDAADVYALLLGPRYGDPSPDTGLAPTEEEFVRARARGIPVLVFTKRTDEPDEPAQAAFKARVGDYINGRFWRSFSDPVTCNQAVGEALKDLPRPDEPVRFDRAGPVDVPWLAGTGLVPGAVSAPVLEVHVVPVQSGHVGAAALAEVADGLARDARASGFVPDREPLDAGSDNWRAARPLPSLPGCPRRSG